MVELSIDGAATRIAAMARMGAGAGTSAVPDRGSMPTWPIVTAGAVGGTLGLAIGARAGAALGGTRGAVAGAMALGSLGAATTAAFTGVALLTVRTLIDLVRERLQGASQPPVNPDATPTPTRSPSPTPSATPVPSATPRPTRSPRPTRTPRPTTSPATPTPAPLPIIPTEWTTRPIARIRYQMSQLAGGRDFALEPRASRLPGTRSGSPALAPVGSSFDAAVRVAAHHAKVRTEIEPGTTGASSVAVLQARDGAYYVTRLSSGNAEREGSPTVDGKVKRGFFTTSFDTVVDQLTVTGKVPGLKAVVGEAGYYPIAPDGSAGAYRRLP